MAFTAADGRQQVLDTLAAAADEIGLALACLGEAYEQLDEYAAERLEQWLFRPAQIAYGRAKRTHADFAQRHDLPRHSFEHQRCGAPSSRARDNIETAVKAAAQAGQALATLQDSMLPVEVGDPALRAGLAEVRELVGEVPPRARDLVRTLGR